ncbi:hypothetical protein TRVL_06874 [Trypanosoma vivax]|nr:hypothetical protein TRVL_06874 [Trypanosoma vivax]
MKHLHYGTRHWQCQRCKRRRSHRQWDVNPTQHTKTTVGTCRQTHAQARSGYLSAKAAPENCEAQSSVRESRHFAEAWQRTCVRCVSVTQQKCLTTVSIRGAQQPSCFWLFDTAHCDAVGASVPPTSQRY